MASAGQKGLKYTIVIRTVPEAWIRRWSNIISMGVHSPGMCGPV